MLGLKDIFSQVYDCVQASISLFVRRIFAVKATVMSSCLLCVWSPCFFSYISGVKRGVCSQINHFPEDADFDHDGAEYVLRKSIPALLGMDDK